MSNPNPINISASIEAKLKNISKQQKVDFRFILIRYANERFLYRLSVSDFANQFILKGGNLFTVWQKGITFRPTVDTDLLCIGQADEKHLKTIFLKLCKGDYKDGLKFDENSFTISPIRENTEYGGIRVLFHVFLNRARIPLQFDIGIGDAITPAPELVEYPVLLNNEIPKIKIYPMATSIAEKVEIMISQGIFNSRMKDFYDIWLLAELFEHDYQTLKDAITNTFTRRNIIFSEDLPECFTDDFYLNPVKQTQWHAFCRKNKLQKAPKSFDKAVKRIKEFISPVLLPLATEPIKWNPQNGWG